MKKLLSILLCLMLLGSTALAAEVVLDGGENRNIKFFKADENDRIDGFSPTTGRVLSVVAAETPEGFAGLAKLGRYMPMLVQISNPEGGIGYKNGKATGNRAPWSAQYADVIYEAPLYKDGNTRLTFVFSDQVPYEAGPVRSARLFHAWLREEWDGGFLFYGQQEYTATNVPAEFKKTGADKKAGGMLLFSGTVGTNHAWKQYYTTFTLKNGVALMDPNDISANVAAMWSLIPWDFEPANHTWLFSDDLPDGGDEAEDIYVTWANAGEPALCNSILEWDEDDECYYRYMLDSKGKAQPYNNLATKTEDSRPITFNNIIVQFTEMEWVYDNAPNPTVTGTGNADYFMGGMHYRGVWNRDTLSDRTVFYDEYGDEIYLQRGRTLIIVMDYQTKNRSISYE